MKAGRIFKIILTTAFVSVATQITAAPPSVFTPAEDLPLSPLTYKAPEPNIFMGREAIRNPFYAFGILDFSIARPLRLTPKQKINIIWPQSFNKLKLNLYNHTSAYSKLTIATTKTNQPYARFLLEFTTFDNPYAQQKSVANYWKAVKKNQKIIKKQEGCIFVDHALRITKVYLLFTEKITKCKYKPGTFITYGKIFRGHDGFYQVNYQFIKQNKDANNQSPYKMAIRSSRLVSYQRF